VIVKLWLQHFFVVWVHLRQLIIVIIQALESGHRKKQLSSKWPTQVCWKIAADTELVMFYQQFTDPVQPFIAVRKLSFKSWGLIYKISNDNLTIILKLRSTYNGRLIYKISYARLFLGTIHSQNCKLSEKMFAN